MGRFRDYANPARSTVREFYRLNHEGQTLDFVRRKKKEYLSLDRRKMTMWEALELLDTLVDDSDPDIDLSQIQHALQTAEAIRADGHPRWFIVTGLIHDAGKILCTIGEPQWAVVGDTFPVGCAFSEKIIYPEFFAGNPDTRVPEYQTRLGIYEEGGGLDKVHLSWGHDEYLYHVLRDHLPAAALDVVRYHSFYAWHRDGAYGHLLADEDAARLEHVQHFNPYDLYSKDAARPDFVALKPFYEDLVGEFLPDTLQW